MSVRVTEIRLLCKHGVAHPRDEVRNEPVKTSDAAQRLHVQADVKIQFSNRRRQDNFSATGRCVNQWTTTSIISMMSPSRIDMTKIMP